MSFLGREELSQLGLAHCGHNVGIDRTIAGAPNPGDRQTFMTRFEGIPVPRRPANNGSLLQEFEARSTTTALRGG
jgi:hypothetical protein